MGKQTFASRADSLEDGSTPLIKEDPQEQLAWADQRSGPTTTRRPRIIFTAIFIALGVSLLGYWRCLSTGERGYLGLIDVFRHVGGGDQLGGYDASRLTGEGDGDYLLGLGIGDVTGPVVETNMMGYANSKQTNTGLHMRQFSRAFIVAERETPSRRIVLINSDIAMGDTGIRRGVLQRLNELYPGMYGESNLALVGTHSHAGVGGFLQNLLPQITSKGLVWETYEAIVNGTVLAVQRAHDSLAPGNLSLGNITLLNSNLNRSPFAYQQNPAEERSRYPYNVDKDFHLLRFEDSGGRVRGFVSLFAVHGTSLYENNTLVSSDNKGMAAYLYESHMEPETHPGKNKFIAGFFQTNVGDSTPNTLGAFCGDTDEPCKFENSTCGGKAGECRGRGPGYRTSDHESNKIIGENQFKAAKNLMENTSLASLKGAVRSLHTYVDMSNYTFALANGTLARTCPPALGYGFAGGTTDGPGPFDFTQGNNRTSQNPLWEVVKGAVTSRPSDYQKQCQAPKPVLLNVGYAHKPYDWSPSIVDIQAFRVGRLVMLIFPGELTTMAGRRLREAVRTKLVAGGIIGEDAYVVVIGPANTYSHYVTTKEEYSVQRYEGGSTLYGPFTLEAYVDIYKSVVPYLSELSFAPPPPGPTPPDLISKAISFQRPVVQDHPPLFKHFGDVLEDVSSEPYLPGQTVSASFIGANPRNNLRLEGTFLEVQRLGDNGSWLTYRTDAYPSTRFEWERTGRVTGTSRVRCSWLIEPCVSPGTYRIKYFGDEKSLIGGKITPFDGVSSSFTVTGP